MVDLKANPQEEYLIHLDGTPVIENFAIRITGKVQTSSKREVSVVLVRLEVRWSVNGDVEGRFACPQMLADHQRRRYLLEEVGANKDLVIFPS